MAKRIFDRNKCAEMKSNAYIKVADADGKDFDILGVEQVCLERDETRLIGQSL